MLKASPIILLDEATSALDTMTEAKVKKAIDHFVLNKTLVTVAHRLSTIKDYDQIIVLDCGRVSEIGDYEGLLSNKGLFYNLVKRGDDHV